MPRRIFSRPRNPRNLDNPLPRVSKNPGRELSDQVK
jgi:hypothetical protein